jgi:hypothetical protein
MQGELFTMRTLLGVFLLSAVLGSQSAASPSKAADANDCSAALPAPVSELIASKFPDWRPKQLSDLESDDRELWLKAHPRECPGIAIGHFEIAHKVSYAALLVAKSEPTGGYKVVVFSKGPTGDAYAWKLLDHADGETYSGLVISKAEPGKYSDFERTKSVQTKLDGVYVEWIEKGADLYYWSAGRYHKLRVSD